jgi:hypothetical protein
MSIHRPTALITPLALLLAGCMTVRIQAGDEPVQVVRHVGLLQVALAAPEQAVVGRLQGLGLVATPMGWSAGYTRQQWAVMGPQCRALLWVSEGGAVDAEMRRTLGQLAGVCLVEAGEVPASEHMAAEILESAPRAGLRPARPPWGFKELGSGPSFLGSTP